MNVQTHRTGSVLLAVVLTLIGLACCAADAAPSTQASVPDGTPSAESLIKDVLHRGGLKLSTHSDTVAKQFEFTVRATLPLRAGGTLETDYLVARDGDRAAILVRSGDDRICAYMASGLFVAPDPKYPAGLLVANTGQPAFHFAANAANERADIGVGFARNGTSPEILLDLGSLLAPALAGSRATRFGPASRTIVITAPHSTVCVTLSGNREREAFPIEDYKITTDDVRPASLEVVDLQVGKPKLDLFDISKHDIEALELPMRELTEEQGRRVGLLALPQDGQGPEQETVRKLGMLFQRKPTTSQNEPPASADQNSTRQSTGAKPGKGKSE